LKATGLEFEVFFTDVNEDFSPLLSPTEVAVPLAVRKAKAALLAKNEDNSVFIGADTVVVAPNGEILGKPKDVQDAYRMLRLLSGAIHTVITGFCVLRRKQRKMLHYSDYDETKVTFKTLTDTEIHEYIATGSPMDKAGAYGLQDLSGSFVSKIEGSQDTVVGLPVQKVLRAVHNLQQK
jgi:septum formation protein